MVSKYCKLRGAVLDHPYLNAMAVLAVSEPTFCVPPFRSAFIAPFAGRKPVEFLAFPSHCLLASLRIRFCWKVRLWCCWTIVCE